MERHEHVEEWVNQRMRVSALEAEWADPAAAWTRFDQRLARRSNHAWRWAIASGVLCAAVFVLPATRAIAQRLWDQVVLGRIQVLVADYESSGAAVNFASFEMQIRTEPRPVASLDEATRAAGFAARLPAIIFADAPRYSVTDEGFASLKLRTPAIRYLLAQVGGSASDVPDNWNGATLDVRLGPIVFADYDGTLLLQSRPFRLITPAGFDLALFYRIAFRSMGISEQDAGALSRDMGVSPALLMFMPKEDRDLLREFNTPRGTGMMIAEVYGKGTITALWSGSDRLYALHGKIDEELVTRVANALE
jgi:hypothetical protein